MRNVKCDERDVETREKKKRYGSMGIGQKATREHVILFF